MHPSKDGGATRRPESVKRVGFLRVSGILPDLASEADEQLASRGRLVPRISGEEKSREKCDVNCQ